MAPPARPPIVLPRTDEPPPVPRAMLLGLGLLLSVCGWQATYLGVWVTLAGGWSYAIAAGFGLFVLGLAVASYTRGFGVRLPAGWRVSGALVLVVATGVARRALAIG